MRKPLLDIGRQYVARSLIRNQLGPLFCQIFGDKHFCRDVGSMGITYISLKVGIGEFLGFDLQVQGFLAVVPPLLDGEWFHDVQHLERGDSLPVGRHLVDGPAMIGGADGVNPFRLEFGQIVGLHIAAKLTLQLQDRSRRFSLVKPIAAMFRDALERSRQFGIAK